MPRDIEPYWLVWEWSALCSICLSYTKFRSLSMPQGADLGKSRTIYDQEIQPLVRLLVVPLSLTLWYHRL
jgi:hypothetical protein